MHLNLIWLSTRFTSNSYHLSLEITSNPNQTLVQILQNTFQQCIHMYKMYSLYRHSPSRFLPSYAVMWQLSFSTSHSALQWTRLTITMLATMQGSNDCIHFRCHTIPYDFISKPKIKNLTVLGFLTMIWVSLVQEKILDFLTKFKFDSKPNAVSNSNHV